jgi:WD40 repeat protein
MKWLQKLLVLFLLFFLVSCMAKPNIRLNAGGVEMELAQPVPMFDRGDLSRDGKYVLTGGWKESGFKLWDISKGAQIKKFSTEAGGLLSSTRATFSQDGKYALSGGKTLKLWDLSSGKELRTISDMGTIDISSFSADGSKVASLVIRDVGWESVKTGGWQSFILLWDTSSWRNITKVNVPMTLELGLPFVVALSPDGRYILSGHTPRGMGGQLKKAAKMVFWDAVTGEELKTVTASDGFPVRVLSVAFSPDGQQALSGGSDGTVRLWDINSRTEVRRLRGHTGEVWYVTFSPDGKYILSGGADGFLRLWDSSSGAEIRTYSAYSGTSSSLIPSAIGYAVFSPDGKHIISVATDAAVRIWNTSTGEEIALLIGFEDGEWLAITSEGYYNSSEKGAQYLKVKFEGTDYTVDQFYDVFYRPDIVSAKLSGQDVSGLISITMKDARKSPPPLVEFTSHTPGNDQQKAKVCYQVKSTGGGIGEVRLFHNGKLIQSDGYYKDTAKSTSDKTQLAALDSKAIYEDMRSVSIKGTADSTPLTSKSKGDVFEDCKEVDAIPGENEVSVSAFNSGNTVQSYMKTINFSSAVKSEAPHLYILSIGIDQYRDNTINLKYAVKDAKDLEDKIKIQSATLYNPQNIHYTLLTDKEATKTNITGKINELIQKIKPQDSFILFVAGHGVLLQNQYYMLTHDFNGEVSDANMISSNEIVEMSKKIKSLSQLFIFDTCHAGGVDTIVSGLYDARMSVLAKKMGLHIYASANDKQAAMDGYKGNGLFTYTLLDGLNNNKEADKNKDGKVTVVGLGEYSKKMTTNISKEIGYSQTPLIINFGKDSPIYKLQ